MIIYIYSLYCYILIPLCLNKLLTKVSCYIVKAREPLRLPKNPPGLHGGSTSFELIATLWYPNLFCGFPDIFSNGVLLATTQIDDLKWRYNNAFNDSSRRHKEQLLILKCKTLLIILCRQVPNTFMKQAFYRNGSTVSQSLT